MLRKLIKYLTFSRFFSRELMHALKNFFLKFVTPPTARICIQFPSWIQIRIPGRQMKKKPRKNAWTQLSVLTANSSYGILFTKFKVKLKFCKAGSESVSGSTSVSGSEWKNCRIRIPKKWMRIHSHVKKWIPCFYCHKRHSKNIGKFNSLQNVS